MLPCFYAPPDTRATEHAFALPPDQRPAFRTQKAGYPVITYVHPLQPPAHTACVFRLARMRHRIYKPRAAMQGNNNVRPTSVISSFSNQLIHHLQLEAVRPSISPRLIPIQWALGQRSTYSRFFVEEGKFASHRIMKARPRPILKTLSSAQSVPSPSTALPFKYLHSPHVHFPPTPTLTSTFPTHSPFVYDRAPIVVSPNACALPERGGRVYNEDCATRRRVSTPIGSYFHPRAFEMAERESVRRTPVDSLSPVSNFPSPSSSSPSMHSAHSYVGTGSPIISFGTSHALLDSYPDTSPLDHTSDELYDSNDFALMPFSVAQLKAKRRQHKMSRRQSTLHLASDSFESSSKEMALDGCLGGF